MRTANTALLLAALAIIGFAAVTVIYLFFAGEGSRWAAPLLKILFFTAIGANIVGYLVGAALRAPILKALNVIITFALILVYALAVISAFPGTGNRIDNQHHELFGWLALLNSGLIIAFAFNRVRLSVLALAVGALIVPLAVYAIIVPAAKAGVKAALAAGDCVLLGKPRHGRVDTARRIRNTDELSFGFFISEHTPRLFFISQDNRVREWAYASQKVARYTWIIRARPAACQPFATEGKQ